MKRGTLGVLILVVAFTVMSSGCATLLSGTSQNVTINSNPPGAHVKIGYQSGITPVTLSVPKGKDYPIEISQGPDKRIVPLRRNVDVFTFLNIIPPLWPGFIVDAVTGSITKYDPDIVSIDFRTRPGADETLLTVYPH